MLAISDEPADEVAKYLKRYRLQFPVAAGSTARYSYGINAFPTAILIDPAGRLAWKGHYSALNDKLLSKVLEDVVLGSPLAFSSETTWEGRVTEAARLAAEGELAAALAALDAIQALEDVSEADSAQAAELRAALEAHVQALVAGAREGVEKDALHSWRLVRDLSRELAGHPLGAPAQALLEELEQTEPMATEIAARKALDAALKVLNKRGLNRARGKLESVVQRFPGTQAADDARALLRR